MVSNELGAPGRPPEIVLPEQPALTGDQWREIARYLFDLLDDIDTIDDIAKSDDASYRQMVANVHRNRFNVGMTNGYDVVFFPKAGA